MADIHITRELLQAVTSGVLPTRVLTEVTWRHLMKLCPYCREEVEAFQRERAAPASYDTAFRVLPLVLQKQSEDLAAKMRSARRDLRDLLRLDPETRRTRVRRANSRFRGVTLAALLLEEAKKHLPADPGAVSDLASLAEQVLLRTVESPGLYGVFARAVAYRANAQRALGKLPEAEITMRDARGLMRSKGVTDPLVYAEVDWVEGALRKDQRKFEEAEELLVRAVNLYTLAGTPAQSSQPLLTLGLLYYDQGEYDRAIEVTKAAAELISPEDDARSYLFARHNLALFLAESGQHRAAGDLLEQDEKLYRRFPDFWTSLRQTWLRGKIARGLGDLETAERQFIATRAGFIEQRNGYDAAMASLDLALVYLQQARTGELRVLAEEMYEAFAAGGVHREAMAALRLFEEAARQERLTVEMVEGLAGYLKRARNNPELRFQVVGS